MSILTTIHYQLLKIKDLMKEDLADNMVTVNYFFCEKECSFLDKVSLGEYLSEKKIENYIFLKSINTLCSKIIDLWNEDFQELPNRMFDQTFHSKKIIFAKLEFHAIYLTETKWHFYNTNIEKIEFTEDFEFKSFQIAEIAQRCSLILNWITAAYPKSSLNSKNKKSKEKELIFEDLFYNQINAEPCLTILKDLDIINSRNEYIFKNKGIIPLWVKLLKNNNPAIIKPFSDKDYVKILNSKIINLNLTNDASEFRKQYKRIDNSDYNLHIKSLISQLSLNGKLGN